MTIFEAISSTSSLLLSFISLIISVIALQISRKLYLLSSKDYIPEINYFITDEGTEIINKNRDLYKIDMINIVKVKLIGFEDRENESLVQIPFIIKSLLYRWIPNKGRFKKVFISNDYPGPCAYNICPYNDALIEKVRQKIQSEYSIDSIKGYALPSLQSAFYIIEILYSDSFQDRKSIIFQHSHIHGYGYDKIKITEEELKVILDQSNIPPFKDIDSLWEYVTKRYSVKY